MTHRIEGACVDIEFLVQGMIQNNVYLISDGTATFVVDPCTDANAINDALGGREISAIIITHRHFDHVGAACDLRDLTKAPVIASAIDAPFIAGEKHIEGDARFKECPVDRRVNDGDTVEAGGMVWKVIATPGHTPGGICLYLESRYGNHPEGRPVLISGDTLFAGAVGRTDFVGGSMDEMKKSIKRLATLPDETLVLPGHDAQTTIGAERTRVFKHLGIDSI